MSTILFELPPKEPLRWASYYADRESKCTVCDHTEDDLCRNRHIIGAGIALCRYCFSAWYEGHGVTREELLPVSLADRATGRLDRPLDRYDEA